MTDRTTTFGQSLGYGASTAQRNKVLRNTYWLLSLSLIPTVLGAWAGVELNIAPLFRGVLGFVLFLAVAFAPDPAHPGLQQRPATDHDGVRRYRWCVFCHGQPGHGHQA